MERMQKRFVELDQAWVAREEVNEIMRLHALCAGLRHIGGVAEQQRVGAIIAIGHRACVRMQNCAGDRYTWLV